MRKCFYAGVSLAAILITACAPQLRPLPNRPSLTSLRKLAANHGLYIGAAVAWNPLQNDPAYHRALIHEFSMVTPENAMKFGRLQPSPFQFEFRQADQVVAAAQAADMKIRGHPLVWHRNLPGWLTEGSWTKQELVEVLHGHVKKVVRRYRGKVMAWDVVNEAVAADGSLRDTFWLKGIGPEYITLAFQWAHEADPDALLFYNDYGGEGLGDKSDAIYLLLKKLLKNGVPLHGVGLQMHLGLDSPLSVEDVQKNMVRLARLGLEIHVTEMDVRIKGAVTDQTLALQAELYRKMMGACLAAKNCTAFVVWGVSDAHSWVPVFFDGAGSALVLDRNYQPKPAYRGLVDALSTSP